MTTSSISYASLTPYTVSSSNNVAIRLDSNVPMIDVMFLYSALAERPALLGRSRGRRPSKNPHVISKFPHAI